MAADDRPPDPHALPTLPIDHRWDDAARADDVAKQLPAAAGVMLLLDAQDRPVTLVATADLRRAARQRLTQPDPQDDAARKRADLRAIVRRVRATTAGSAFEADWIYLQHARRVAPDAARAMLDRFPAWFIACDPADDYPRWQKTNQPPARSTAVHLGPFLDKHAAGRFMEGLVDLFDLCREYPELLRTPHGRACPYKEMGRCPAPCDGTVPIDVYHESIRASIDFGARPLDDWCAAGEDRMQAAAADHDFETAAMWKRRLDTAASLRRGAFELVDRLERFAFVALLPAESSDHARVMLIRGGAVRPWATVPLEASPSDDAALAKAIDDGWAGDVGPIGREAMDMIGLAAGHLFRSRRRGGSYRGGFEPWRRPFDPKRLAALRRRLRKAEASEKSDNVTDRSLDAAPSDPG